METRRLQILFTARGTRRVRLQGLVGALFAILLVSALLGWLVFVQFLLSLPGLVVTSALNVAIASALLAWSFGSERDARWLSARRSDLLVRLFFLPLVVAAMFPLFSGVMPDLYTRCYGKEVSFPTTVDKKIRTRAYTIKVTESRPIYARNPVVDRFTWDAISVGDTVVVKGMQSLFGVSISDIELPPKPKPGLDGRMR